MSCSYNTGAKTSYFTLEGNLHGGLSSRPFKITPTRWCGDGCPQVRPQPGAANKKLSLKLLLALDMPGNRDLLKIVRGRTQQGLLEAILD